MIYQFSHNGSSEPIEMKQLSVIHDMLNPEPEEVEVFPLRNIPVECEDERVHDGVNPCGDPTCYCALYGYGVPSLD